MFSWVKDWFYHEYGVKGQRKLGTPSSLQHVQIAVSEHFGPVFRLKLSGPFRLSQLSNNSICQGTGIAIGNQLAVVTTSQNFPDAVRVGPDNPCPGRQGLDDGDAKPLKNGRDHYTPGLVVQGIQLIIRDESQKHDVALQVQLPDKRLHLFQIAPLPPNE